MSIRVEIELEDGRFVTRMLHAGESVDKFNRAVARSDKALRAQAAAGNLVFTSLQRVNDSNRTFISNLRDAAIVVGAFGFAVGKIKQIASGWIGDIVKVNAEMERLTFLMSGMSQAADPMKDAANQVAAFRDIAKTAPFTMAAIQDSAVKLKAVGIEPLDGALRSMIDGVAAFGGSDEALKRGILAITQMSGKGVIQMEELRQQLGEAIPRATELMARSMGLSYSQLMAKINTGTVAAKPALNALFKEFERTFGGASQRLMQSFSGQLAKTQTLLQERALDAGGTGFFENVKEQLRDLNDFLSSDAGANFAKLVGSSLNDMVTFARQAVEWLFKFRNEIISAGKAMLVFLSARAAIAGFMQMRGVIDGLRTTLSALRIQWELVTVAQRKAAQVAVVTSALNGQVGALASMNYQLRRTTAMVPAMLGAFARSLPIIGAVAAVVLLAADYFGLFSDKAKEATDAAKQFGIVNREQATIVAKSISDQEARLKGLLKMRDQILSGKSTVGADNGFAKEVQTEIDKVQKALTESRKSLGAELKKFDDDEANRQAERLTRTSDNALAANLRQRDQQLNILAKAYEKERAELTKAKKSVEDVERQYSLNIAKINVQTAEANLAALNQAIDDQREALRSAIGDNVAIGEAAIDKLSVKVKEAYDQLKSAREDIPEIETLAKDSNLDAMLGRGQKHLERIRSEAEGFRFELEGSTRQMGKLVSQLESGRYGDPNDSRVKELITNLKTEQAVRDRLDAQAKQMRKSQALADTARTNTDERRLELIEREAAARSRLLDPLEQKRSSGLVRYINLLDDMVRATSNAYGAESAAMRKSTAERETMIRRFKNIEIVEKSATYAQQNRELKTSLLTERQQREENLRYQTQILQRELLEYTGTGEQRVLVERNINERIRLLREQAAQASPMGQAVKEWSDWSGALETSMVGWVNSFSNSLSQMVATGKVDFKSLANSIIADLTRIAINWAFSKIFGGPTAGATAGGSFLGMTFHTGGIVGKSNNPTRAVDPSLFMGAPRFHTGGIVGNEVPIIAQKGEGVFTPGQMAAMGGSNITLAPVINMNAQGGSPEQNHDLAKQVSNQVERSMKAMITDQFRQQMRPGGMLSGR